MKTNIRTLGFLLVLVTATVIYPKQAAAQQDYVSLQVFYDELSPYGEWVESAQYGYVWIPDAGADFMPYSTAGQWVNTNYGWTWVSDYPWGWAPFHYGRWDHDNYYGWLWVPDYEWGPSWVTWRSASGYYGWQPMRPGITINLSFGNDYYNNYNDYWMFVSDNDFQRSNVSRYYVNQTNRDRIIRNSTVINNTFIDNSRNSTYISGPARDDVQRTTGKRVSSVAIRENSKPGQTLKNGQLQIYRPNVRKNADTGRKPAPNRITSREDVKRPSERDTKNQQQNIDRNKAQPAQQQKVNQSENIRLQQQQQQRQNTINKQNVDKNKVQPVQQPQRQNNINQQNINKKITQPAQQQRQNIDKNNVQPVQQQQQRQNINKVNAQPVQQQQPQQRQNVNKNNVQPVQQQQQRQNINKVNAQPAQQQKVNAPQNAVREQRQEKDSKSQENKNRQ